MGVVLLVACIFVWVKVLEALCGGGGGSSSSPADVAEPKAETPAEKMRKSQLETAQELRRIAQHLEEGKPLPESTVKNRQKILGRVSLLLRDDDQHTGRPGAVG